MSAAILGVFYAILYGLGALGTSLFFPIFWF